MRKLSQYLLSVTICISALGQFAQAADAYYPLGCFYNEGELNYPIINARGGNPIAMIDGKLKKVSGSDIRFDRLELYADGYIDIKKTELEPLDSDARTVQVTESGEKIPNRTFLDVAFISDKDIDECYAVVFSGSKAAIEARDVSELFVGYKTIGKITAGKVYEESLAINLFYSASVEGDQNYFIVFYDAGLPIRSQFDAEVSQHFITRRQQEFEFYLTQYLENNQNADLKQQPFYTYTPYLPKALYAQTGPIQTKVVLKIAADGSVSAASFSGLDDEEAKAFISKRISEWLFFPKLENGKAVATKIATMIEF